MKGRDFVQVTSGHFQPEAVSLDVSECVISDVHLSPMADYYQKNLIPCSVLLIAFLNKRCSFEGHHQKIELLQSAPSRVPLINVSPSISLLSSFSGHFSSSR